MSDSSQGPGWWQASDGKWYPPASPPPSPPPSGPLPAPSGTGTSPAGAWYEKTWVLVVSLIVCFPVGLAFVWMNSRFTQKTKLVISGVVAALVVVGAIANAANPPEETKDAASATTEAPTTSTEGPPVIIVGGGPEPGLPATGGGDGVLAYLAMGCLVGGVGLLGTLRRRPKPAPRPWS